MISSRSIRLCISSTNPQEVLAQPGHVYLLEQKQLKHWVLFQVELQSPR